MALNVWMFGSRTTVKKVRNSLTWFSHGSGATLAPEPLVRVPFSTTRVFETLFFFDPCRTPNRPRRQCGTIQEDSCQELAFLVMEEISMEVQLKE